jgi:hypothetical protein
MGNREAVGTGWRPAGHLLSSTSDLPEPAGEGGMTMMVNSIYNGFRFTAVTVGDRFQTTTATSGSSAAALRDVIVWRDVGAVPRWEFGPAPSLGPGCRSPGPADPAAWRAWPNNCRAGGGSGGTRRPPRSSLGPWLIARPSIGSHRARNASTLRHVRLRDPQYFSRSDQALLKSLHHQRLRKIQADEH